MSGWPCPQGRSHHSAQAARVPQPFSGVDWLVNHVEDFYYESSGDDSGYSDEEEHLEGVRSLRLRRRSDAWGYPGDVLRCIEGEHAKQPRTKATMVQLPCRSPLGQWPADLLPPRLSRPLPGAGQPCTPSCTY
jgi:hypothetical protein